MNELALKASAALLWLGAVGIGATACAVLPLFIRSHSVPTMKGMRLFGGGAFERLSPKMFSLLLAAFVVVCLLQVVAGYLLWTRDLIGVVLVLALLPVEIAFWVGFAMPYPPPVAVVRLIFLALGWSALR
ncbi:MAG TPA: hypothetical protein VHO95_13755 [Candidatus Dormibacteraeota bacterium]|nr:hypothetical protein [Candidatus Dormibacteraeota bacterium]